MSDIPSVRAFIAGNSGSGKTTTAWNVYLRKFQRRLILDSTGEWEGRTDFEAGTLGECVTAIRTLAGRGHWTVSYTMLDDGFPELVRWLVPMPNLDRSPARIVGGMVILVDEVDALAPFGPPPRYIRDLYRRSRHCGLSVVSCTQAPSNVSKEVPRQSTQRIVHFLDEPADQEYIRDAMRWPPEHHQRWLEWCQRYRHGAVWKETQTGRLLLLPDSGSPVLWDVPAVSALRPRDGQAQESRQAVPAQRRAVASPEPTPPQPLAQQPRRQQPQESEG